MPGSVSNKELPGQRKSLVGKEMVQSSISRGWAQLTSDRELAIFSSEPPKREKQKSHQGCPGDVGLLLSRSSPLEGPIESSSSSSYFCV